MTDELAKYRGLSLLPSKSPTVDSEDPGDLSRSRSCGHHYCRAVLQERTKLARLCEFLGVEISVLKEALILASRRADYDALTGLPNRALLLDRFAQALALGKRHRQRLALLFLDLDDFKRVNDQHGHDCGDQLLQQVAARLSDVIRASDTACRYGGDEFVVLLTEISGRDSALTAATAVLESLAPPYAIHGKSIDMSVSIGMAVYPEDGVDYTELLRHSDRSMFRNKAGRTPPASAAR